MVLLFILIILLFDSVVASVKLTFAATPCKHAMFVDVDLTLGGRCTGVMCSSDNCSYVDIAKMLLSTAVINIFFITIIITTIIIFINIIIVMIIIFTLLSRLPAHY